ncbi:type II secretion system protein GspM [Aestuariivita sp.]|jgi:type II secretory pathway component PulM|uniref:type II secretion system protein GspM n=1 Tax=Aestuariivita sp. TaxID=1872407 RepID=UPI00217371E3|nr:type II secretion system protein GspM [Aestuariivita sp.]MCE8009871.1 type II secretion system protein M [Aestuariivita sp.]
MTDRLIEMLLHLSSRERRLLGILVFAAFPLALWFAVLEPLREARTVAAQDLEEARALTLWLSDRAADHAALTRAGDSGPRAPIGSSGLEQSLISAGLRDQVSALTNRAQGGIELRFDDVPFVALADWLSRSDPGWGYDIASLRIERTDEPGRVAADLVLAPQEAG